MRYDENGEMEIINNLDKVYNGSSELLLTQNIRHVKTKADLEIRKIRMLDPINLSTVAQRFRSQRNGFYQNANDELLRGYNARHGGDTQREFP